MIDKSNRVDQANDQATGSQKARSLRNKQLSPMADDGWLDGGTVESMSEFMQTEHSALPGRGGAPVFHSYIQRMQQTHGNSYVQRMIESGEHD